MQTLLTDSQIATAESLAEQINTIPGLIRTSVTTFESVINNATINAWITDTQVGAETKTKVDHNNDTLNSLAGDITEIYQTTMQLISASKRSNANP